MTRTLAVILLVTFALFGVFWRAIGGFALASEFRPAAAESRYGEEIMMKPAGPPNEIRSWMTSPVKTVKPLDTLARARE